MLRATHAPNRRAFTLVEMLVSSALILFVMYILASCFQQALASFGQLRASGDLQERLRLASMIIRDDLKQEHFDSSGDPNNPPVPGVNDGRTLGEQRLDKGKWQPPAKGFFRIYQGSAAGANPVLRFPSTGLDVDNLVSYQVSDHYLHFTVHLGGVQGTDKTATIQNGRDQLFQTQFLNQAGGPDQTGGNGTGAYDFYDPDPSTGRPTWVSPPYLKFDAPTWDANSTLSPGRFTFSPYTNTDPSLQRFFYTPWAEVAYYLRPSGQTAGGNSLYVLYRRQRLLLDDTYVTSTTARPLVPPAPVPGYLPPTPTNPALVDMSFWQRSNNTFEMNTPVFTGVPQRRFGMDPSLIPGRFLTSGPAANQFPIFGDPSPTGMGPTSNQAGDDILLSDVLSFEVKVDWTPPGLDPTKSPAGTPNLNDFPAYAQPPFLWNYGTNYQDSAPRYKYKDSSGTVQVNPDYPFDDLPLPGGMAPNSNGTRGFNLNYGGDVRVFDTWARQTDGLGAYDFIKVPGGAGPNNTDSVQQQQEAWSTGYLEDHSPTATNPRPNSTRPTTIPLRIRVRALQIRIRIWDAKAKVARQITIVQDM